MAILICPNCKGKISSTAEVCVHCGEKFIVCPECSEAAAFDAEVCSGCGYGFKKDGSFEKEVILMSEICSQPQERAAELYNEWSETKTVKNISLADSICYWADLLFYGLIILLFITKTDSWVGLFYAGLFIVFVPIVAKAVLVSLKRHLSITSFPEWIEKKGIDLLSVIRAGFDNGFSAADKNNVKKEKEAVKLLIENQAARKSHALKGKYMLFYVMKVALSLIAQILATAWFFENAEAVAERSLSSLSNVWMIIAWLVLTIAADLVVFLIGEKISDDSCTAWVEENMPEYIDSYVKNIKDMVSNKD